MGRSYLPEAWARHCSASFGVRALAAALASYADGECGDHDVWPSQGRLAVDIGATTRTVQTLAAEGESLGWWTRIYLRRRASCELTYRLHFPLFSYIGSREEVGQKQASEVPEAGQNLLGSGPEAEQKQASGRRVQGFNGSRAEDLPTAGSLQEARGASAKAWPLAVAEKPPTLAEVTAFFAELGHAAGVAADFIDYWTSVGWMRGKTPMRDWRAAAHQNSRRMQSDAHAPRNAGHEIRQGTPDYD